jgi:hypothetical protein
MMVKKKPRRWRKDFTLIPPGTYIGKFKDAKIDEKTMKITYVDIRILA